MTESLVKNLLILEDATLRYSGMPEGKAVFSGLHFSIDRGSRVAVVGPNGCGKSSLLKSILGLISLSEGRVRVELSDSDILSAIIQDYRQQLLLRESWETNMCLPFEGGRQIDISQQSFLGRIDAILGKTGYAFSPDARICSMSGGQQQALVLARSLAFEPGLYLWDEPLSAIDFAKRGLFYRHIRTLWDETAASAIIATHDVDEAILLADRVLVFDASMKVLFDEDTPKCDGLRDHSFLDSDSARRFRDCIRRAMFDDPNSPEAE